MLKSREQIQEIRRKVKEKSKSKEIESWRFGLKNVWQRRSKKWRGRGRERNGGDRRQSPIPFSLLSSLFLLSFLNLSCFLGEIILECHLQEQAGSGWRTRACLATRLESSPNTFCPRSQRPRTSLLPWLSVYKGLKEVVSNFKIRVVEISRKERNCRIDLGFDTWLFVSFFGQVRQLWRLLSNKFYLARLII